MVIDKEEMVGFREELETRYSLGSTVPGTIIFQLFPFTSVSSVEWKHLSIDTVYPVKHLFSELRGTSNYVARLFDSFRIKIYASPWTC